jgi:thiamine-monophosphate kinase
MDVSDGLVGDLAKLCRASGVAAEVDVSRVPLSEAAQVVLVADTTLIETILTGGDDYEILLTLPPEKLPAFRTAADRVDIAVTEIGRIVAGEGARFLRNGQALTFARPSYSHF